jgi:hypothetical protein
MRRGLVTFYLCIVDGKKQGGGMGMFASYTILTNAFRHRSLLTLMDSQSSDGRVLVGRSFGLLRPIVLSVGDMGGRAVGTK